MAASEDSKPLAPTAEHVRLDSRREARFVRSAPKHWQPPEGLAPDDVKAVIDAADRGHVKVATGGRRAHVSLKPSLSGRWTCSVTT
jgi:hypothetical protein